MKPATPKTGDVFEHAYPFVRDTFESWEGDSEGGETITRPTWKPGVRHADKGEGDVDTLADALGKQVLAVISTHRPGRWPLRVFYTVQWVNPEGVVFGKSKCRVSSITGFRIRASGYRHEFKLVGCDCAGCKWPHHDHRYGQRLRDEEAAVAEGYASGAPA